MELQLLTGHMELEKSYVLQWSATPEVVFLLMRALCLSGTPHSTHTYILPAVRDEPKSGAGDLRRGTHLGLSSAKNCSESMSLNFSMT